VERQELTSAIAEALADLQAAYDDRRRALADYLGIGRTDLRCLDLIVRHGPQTAASLGAQLHLTRGSMTTLIDRLERAGYAHRHNDPEHGKRKLVAPTPQVAEAIAVGISARRDQGIRELDAHTDAELRTILAFLHTTLDQQAATREAYRALTPHGGHQTPGPERAFYDADENEGRS
jgi:DNA-binding MarR family transcriptional regulator